MPLFFESTLDRWGHEKIIIFYPWRSPPGHIAPNITENTGIIRIFGPWGLFFKRVERQGKSAQNLCIEPNNVPPNFTVPSITF